MRIHQIHLVTVTDSEVLCRLVSTFVGPGGKDSLANTVDDDILQYILNKLRTKIEVTARTFLIKVKAHRDEHHLNEREDA